MQLIVIIAFFIFSQYDLVEYLLIEQFAYSDIKLLIKFININNEIVLIKFENVNFTIIN